MHYLPVLALAGSAAAQLRGFNYGALYADNRARTQQDFEADFNAARNLPGTSGFTSARLFTMVQGYTTDTVISAIPAAIATNTRLLLGLWASAGEAAFANELTALRNAINQYGTEFTDLVVGISVGSEDLYRISPTGIENESGPGAGPDQLVGYIQRVRDLIAGTAASEKTIGHVDTWTAYVNGSNSAVIAALDWLGMDGYPYFQTVNANGIENGEALFFESYNATVGAAQGKPVWVTETGWPVTGPQSGAATAGIANAQTYWSSVACRLLGNINTFWYQLNDGQTAQDATSFRIINADRGAPLYDLSCPNGEPPSAPSSSPAPEPTTTAEVTLPTAPNPTTPVATSISLPIEPTVQPPKPSTLVTSASSSASAAPPSAPSLGGCPTNLNGPFEFPHLLVPVNSADPDKAYGTQYSATISSTTSSIFNFDIHPDHAGKTCSLVFLFPEQKDLKTSSFTFNGKGGLSVSKLTSPATEQTTYGNKPASSGDAGKIDSIAPGSSYSIWTGKCEAGARVGYEFSAIGGAELEYFQDYNLPGIGAYVTVC